MTKTEFEEFKQHTKEFMNKTGHLAPIPSDKNEAGEHLFDYNESLELIYRGVFDED